MPTSHDLKGLMKFLAREEWRECFDEVFYDHFGPVLDAGDMDFDDIGEILGEVWAMTLWGCAFEDFLTQDFEVEGGNIVDEYLKRRGWKENAQAKSYMKALRTSVMSLYEVSEIELGKSLIARDLLRGGDPIAVSEGTATKTLKQWDRIAARIVPLMGKNVFAGALLPFTPQATDALFDGLRQMFGKKNAKKLPAIKDEELQPAASMFTLSWLFDALERAMGLPSVQNADGDELIFHDVRFPLASGVTQKDLAARVSTIPGMSQENAKFWNWLEQKPKHGARKRSPPSFDTTMENGARVLGNIELKGKFLHLSTNSAERAQNGTTLIQQALGDLVRAPLTEIRTVEQMMAERPAREKEEPGSEIPPEIAEQVVHQFMDRQYRETLDQPVGMLGNKTPRQAAKSATGREKVAGWLKYLENQSSRHPPADPMATYSFEWMWHELGVIDLRQ
ncbi:MULTISPECIES: hypothetical protein [Rhizobium]|uniref:DUF2384 domain-containing protein n=1 Tax=Rhizobium aouanii TaxID=3118145 RepID=A0ABU8CJL3_9HYPH|nr:hypothetical protein [Rhizobium acaciae]MCW1410858.1 hypothetical protein [Rhizobium acaciae]MCW1742843.1 hypothetical protein [Rhizobium acaciae]MCW1750039.1 hypothetical protein [Rhizobium acaciae]